MEKDGSSHSSSSTDKVKEDSATTQAKGDRLDKSLEDEFKRIASSTDRDKLQKKYDKLKRIYLKLKQKYVEKEEQKRQETAKRPPEERVEIVTIKDEQEDFDLPMVSNTSVIEKKNLTRIAPKTKQSREYSVPVILPKDDVAEETDEEQCTGQTVRGKKTGGRRKSSRPRKKEEEDEENGEGMKLEDDVDNEDYLPLNSEPEDDNDEPWDDGEDVDMNDEDEPEKKKRKKTRSKPEIRIKLKDKIKNKEKKEAQVFRCDICGKFLSSRPILEKHHRIHTGERPYQCHICGKSFNSLSSFNNHTRIHNGIKPYKCRHCDKCFTETSQRTTHERTHTGEKPYMCDLCGGRFSLRSSLVRHRRIHTGEKPYVCSECGAAYCQYTQLSHHKKKCGRIPSLPTMTPLHFMSDLSDTAFQGSLAEHKSKKVDSTEEKQDKPDTNFDGEVQKQVKVEKMTDTSNLEEPLNKDDSDHKARHSVSGTSPRSSESYSPPFVQNMGERDVRLQNSFSNFQHFQPYVHALNHPVGNISAFPSPEVVAREAMERFTSMHPSWFVNNTQSG